MLAPASGFYGSAGLGRNEVRLAYVLNQESIAAAMDCSSGCPGSLSCQDT